MNSDVFTSKTDLPTKDQDPDFWRLVSDKNTKKCIVLLILDQLRRYDPLRDNDTRVLGKLKGYQEMIDLFSTLSGEVEESLPSDDPFDRRLTPAKEKK